MRSADRRDDSYRNSIRHPRSRQPEPLSSQDSAQRLATLRSQNAELRQQVTEVKTEAEQTQDLYLKEQKRYQSALTLYEEENQKYESTLTLYREVQTQAESYLAFYEEEKTRNGELLVKYETAQSERDRYIVLYNESQAQLKFERRSKAGIKGWETRRKRENDLLKKEIFEMTHLLRDSLERKEEAIDHLEELASRMDRIQHLVDSVGEDSTGNPAGLLQKFKRIWQAMQEILAE
ncbi:hypothetical protein C7271_19460 [filamentous cyanobacterium CCP5]|nr:hypothetical protein C7271_19460 [filamentous cyanobacterium CCP5]